MPDDSKKQEAYLTILTKLIKDVQYGSVTLVVQDGKVIQIDQNKKIRL